MKFELFKLFPETIGTYLIPYDKKNDFFTKKLTFRETEESKEKEIATGSFISNDLYLQNLTDMSKNYMLFYDNSTNKVFKGQSTAGAQTLLSSSNVWSGKNQFSDVSLNGVFLTFCYQILLFLRF